MRRVVTCGLGIMFVLGYRWDGMNDVGEVSGRL
jgi:hypothetical protein